MNLDTSKLAAELLETADVCAKTMRASDLALGISDPESLARKLGSWTSPEPMHPVIVDAMAMVWRFALDTQRRQMEVVPAV